jgi:hypothetical protein
LRVIVLILIHHAGEKQSPTPYVVNVTVAVQSYDPVSFILAKHCGMDSLGPYHLHQIQVSLLFLLQYLSQVPKLFVEVSLNLCAVLQTEVTNNF